MPAHRARRAGRDDGPPQWPTLERGAPSTRFLTLLSVENPKISFASCQFGYTPSRARAAGLGPRRLLPHLRHEPQPLDDGVRHALWR
jgi:hypothetical protein